MLPPTTLASSILCDTLATRNAAMSCCCRSDRYGRSFLQPSAGRVSAYPLASARIGHQGGTYVCINAGQPADTTVLSLIVRACPASSGSCLLSIAGARCVVLGAGGFLGINLCRSLLAAGAQVTGFGRRPHNPDALPHDLAWHDADFADAARIADAVAGQDLVYHLLGGSVPAQSNNDPAADVVGSLLPSLRLMEACRAGHVGRLVFASSGGTIYGPTPVATPLPETAPTQPITAYGINKLAVEKYLGLFRHLHGFDAIALRIANPYGPFQHHRRAQGVVGTALAHGLAGEPIEIWGDGLVVRDYLHVDDVAAAMVAAGSYRGKEWVFNVGSGEGRSVRAVVDDVCALLGLAPERVIHRPGRAVDVPFNVLDSSLIAREMGWTPAIGWQAGLAATAQWMREQAPDSDLHR